MGFGLGRGPPRRSSTPPRCTPAAGLVRLRLRVRVRLRLRLRLGVRVRVRVRG